MAATYGLDKVSITATLASKIRWMMNIGVKGYVQRVSIPLAGMVAANTTITPTLYFDDLSSSLGLTAITNANYPGKRKIIYKGTELKNAIFQNNLVLEISYSGTNPLPVALPIIITVDLLPDEPV